MQPHQFYEVLPDGRYRFRVDHHTINDSNTCDRYFEYRHVGDESGLVWGAKTLNIKIAIGSWWSSVMESLYNDMAHGTMPSQHHMLKFASDAWQEHKMEDYAKADPEKFEKFGGLDGARLMAMEYYNGYAVHHFTQWTIIGPELGFGWRDECYLGENDRVVVYYGGKPDLTVIEKATRMVLPLDFKTKDNIPGNANVMYKPHPQTAGYIYALRKMFEERGDPNIQLPTKCIIMICARQRPTEKPRSGVRQPRFAAVYPNYSLDEINEWRESVIWKCSKLRDNLEAGYFPPRESACHLFYHGCMFRRACQAPRNARQMILNADYIKVNPWVPYDTED